MDNHLIIYLLKKVLGIRNQNEDELKIFLKTISKLKDMSMYIPNYSIGKISANDLSKSSIYEAIHYFLQGLGCFILAVLAYCALSETSFILRVLVFVFIGAFSILLFCIGMKIISYQKKYKIIIKKLLKTKGNK